MYLIIQQTFSIKILRDGYSAHLTSLTYEPSDLSRVSLTSGAVRLPQSCFRKPSLRPVHSPTFSGSASVASSQAAVGGRRSKTSAASIEFSASASTSEAASRQSRDSRPQISG